MVSLFHTWK